MLLLRVVHSDLKDRRSLAAQKGHSGLCACHAPFQAVDAAAPILSPKEVVAMVTQAEGVIQFRTLVYNLGMEETFLKRGRQIEMSEGRLGALVVLTPTGDPERTLSIRSSQRAHYQIQIDIFKQDNIPNMQTHMHGVTMRKPVRSTKAYTQTHTSSQSFQHTNRVKQCTHACPPSGLCH